MCVWNWLPHLGPLLHSISASTSPSSLTTAATATATATAVDMGEQSLTNPAPDSQIDSDPAHQSPSQKSDSIPPISHSPDLSDVILTEISHTSHNPSKIPVRPPKIRKLSSAPVTDQPSSFALTSTPIHSAKNHRRPASRVSPKLIRPLSANGEVALATRFLRVADPLLVPLIDGHPPPRFESRSPPFVALSRSILYQQLAYKAGASIYTRFVSLCGGEEESISPDSVLALSVDQLKQIGVSARKTSYLHDLANKYKSGILSDDSIVKMDDKSLFAMLSMVKGIGSWSVHMFMIFSLHRPDVLPFSDLGVRKGVQLLYGLKELPRPSKMEQLCEKWRPFRSVGSWYMWRLEEANGGSTTGSVNALMGSDSMPLQKIEPQQEEHQHQLQFVEPVNGMGDIGSTCVWNQ